MNIIDQYVMEVPSPQHPVNLFAGEWASKLPLEGVTSGTAELFADARITQIAEAAGTLEGKKVLELGPLEAGHTSMMLEMGASSILAVEANSRAFLKCLIVKEVMRLRGVDFLLGDFDAFLEKNSEKFDFTLACGVIYHCENPIRTLCNLTRVSDTIGIWSHYYIEERVKEIYGERFSTDPVEMTWDGHVHTCFKHNYAEGLENQAFCGGGNSYTHWMPRDQWIELFSDLGFKVTVLGESTTHPNGPEFTLIAQRR